MVIHTLDIKNETIRIYLPRLPGAGKNCPHQRKAQNTLHAYNTMPLYALTSSVNIN